MVITMRLIDADKLKAKAITLKPYEYRQRTMMVVETHDIDHTPTVDPVKHGQWIARTIVINNGTKSKTKIYTQCKCSVCGALFGGKSDNFCYHCGAKMDEEG